MAYSKPRGPPKKFLDDDFRRRDSIQSRDWAESRTKENFLTSVKKYSQSKASFKYVYASWLPMRRSTLMELRSLYEKVHEKALKYNKNQAELKEMSYTSRVMKQEVKNEAMDFLFSIAEFIGDAGSGLSSIAQACSIDTARTKFKEIMENDAEITKKLHTAKSRCVAEYKGIEEVMRSFEFNTFNSTMDKLSDIFETMGCAYKQDDMPKLLNAAGNFFDKVEKATHSIKDYVDDNPETVEACKSTGKAIFRAIDNFGDKNDKDEKSVVERATSAYMMVQDRMEIDRLRSVVAREDTCQSKLESQIQEAIQRLESEMREMIGIYSRWSVSRTYDDDSD